MVGFDGGDGVGCIDTINMDWIKQNSITLIIIISSISVSWGIMNSRVDAITKKVDSYPSQDWFELKFENVDKDLEKMNEKLDKHIDSMKAASDNREASQNETRRY